MQVQTIFSVFESKTRQEHIHQMHKYVGYQQK